MKEKKFKDVKGFENKNTFFLFDQWETQLLHGAKNRYIYDIAFPTIPGKPVNYIFPNTQSYAGDTYTTFENLSQYGAHSVYLGYGYPGDLISFITDDDTQFYGARKNEINPKTWNNYTNTVNEEEMTFVFNENAIGYTDQVEQDNFGTIKLANWVDFFRSGYLEFSIKTTKQNCIIASGTSEIDSRNLASNPLFITGASTQAGASVTSLFVDDTVQSNHPVTQDYPYYLGNSPDGALINLNICIKDGKICIEYYDTYNRDNVNFTFIGNEFVADNEWHHVVVNFGRPGLIKQNGTKFNKKFIEIWIDSQLDKRFDSVVNEYQIFYPTVKWLFNNITECYYQVINNELDIENSVDVRPFSSNDDDFFIGLDNIIGTKDIFVRSVRSPANKIKAFSGALHTFAHGVNIPLSQYEIKKRFRLWKKQTKKYTTPINVTAKMVTPSVSANKKRALKLYWDNLVSVGKHGVELDNNFEVECYSVINQTLNSKTDIFNLDKTNIKELNILKNVKVAVTDNVLVLGPGKVWTTNTEEAYYGIKKHNESAAQKNPKNNIDFDSTKGNYSGVELFKGPRTDLTISGLNLIKGDRILLTGQIKTEENGIWVFNGMGEYLTRDTDSLITENTKQTIVYVTDGYNKNTYWVLENAIESFVEPQKWYLSTAKNIDEIQYSPINVTRWKDYHGEDRFINLEEDIDISKYSLITFMNYPETNDEIFANFPNDPQALILKQYSLFLNSIKNVVTQGASIYVSSPKLATDLKIVKSVTYVDQQLQNSDLQSSSIDPFDINEDADQFFDTHRINKYNVATTVSGLTNKQTYLLTDFINYSPSNVNNYEQYHAKYSYRQFGLQQGDEFIIPSLTLREITNNDKLPGYKNNKKGSNQLITVEPQNVITGTTITKLQNNYYNGGTLISNPYDDNVTTLIVHNNQLLDNQPVQGKIFVNFVEDAYTMSRQEYNKSIIQTIPQNDPNETVSTRMWQYSTSRLNRLPRKINIRELTRFGQTKPTNGGGGPLIQAPSNSSNGMIRSSTDSQNIDYQSDLYPTEAEEIYSIQEIPTLSMTWLGLQWLAE